MTVSAAGSNAITWNIVNQGVIPGTTVTDKLVRRIGRLARHLGHFPSDAMHLQVALSKLEKKGIYTVKLTLRLPSNILYAAKSDKNLLRAIDVATKALEREVDALRSELRRDFHWKRPAWRARLNSEKEVIFGDPMETGTGPQTDADMVSDLLAKHEERLLAHARRELRVAELTEEIPHGWITIDDLVDEAARHALSNPEQKPEGLTYEHWFYRLISTELARVRKECAEDRAARGESPLPDRRYGIGADDEEGYDAAHPLYLVTNAIDPDEPLPEERFPDPKCPSPDTVAAGYELIDILHQEVKNWSPIEQGIFELHYLSGFESGDIAMIRGLKKEDVDRLLDIIHQRLRKFVKQSAR
jgi:DNA-directed RNA polymerase specialized sigma24 family protein/ribosome-associated translation inhibitor RaiA